MVRQIEFNTHPEELVAERSALEIAWTSCLLYKAYSAAWSSLTVQGHVYTVNESFKQN